MTIISLLRAVNVGGTGKLPMTALKSIYEGLGFEDVQTYIQSGNVVFRCGRRPVEKLGAVIEDAIEKAAGFRPVVLVRTVEQWRQVVAGNPFEGERDPAKMAVLFLQAEPTAREWREKLAGKMKAEELELRGRELYAYFPEGMGQSKVAGALERALGAVGTARNWNTVLKLLALCG